jgi:hypothetical protein
MLKVEFVIPIQESWKEVAGIIEAGNWYFIPVEKAIAHTDALTDLYLSYPQLSPPHFVGGFSIEIEGCNWNQYYLGQFWQSLQWLSGLTRIVNGESLVLISVFENSRLLLRRNGKSLTMYETWEDLYPRTDFCGKAEIALDELLDQVDLQSAHFAQWVVTMRQEAVQRLEQLQEQEKPEKKSLLHSFFFRNNSLTSPSAECLALELVLQNLPLCYVEQVTAFGHLLHKV